MKLSALKRLVLVFLSLALVFSLFACGDNTGNTPSDDESDVTDETPSGDDGSDESKEATDESLTTESEPDEDHTNEETSSESNGPDEPVETEWGREIVSFVNYTTDSRGSLNLKSRGDAAVSFTVPDGYLKEFYLNLSNEVGYVACGFTVKMYRFNGSYEESVQTETIYSTNITSTMKTTTLTFEDEQFGAGDYLLVVSYDKSVGADHYTVMIDGVWNEAKIPENYKQYAMVSYINGEINDRSVMCCAMAVERNLPASEPEEAPETEKDPENVAKVILLAGQSNAAGVSVSSILEKKISAEEFAKYKNGFSNVKILYKNGNLNGMANCNEEFVNVQLGQGFETINFGPEVGLAAYLSEAYPDETFYIIKYGVGGTNIFSHWNTEDPTRNQHLLGFKSTIDAGLEMLEADGLTPKIVGLLWMQGESDSTQFYHAHEYYNRQKAFVEHIRETYADYASVRGIEFIDAAVSNSGFFASWFLVNDMKLKYSKESDDNYFIDTISYGLTTLEENNDLAHYDSISMLILGRLFGDKLAYALDGDKDDGICPHKESDLKSDKEVHYTECELCKVRLSEGAHVPTGSLVYDAEAKAYKGDCVCGAYAYNDFYFETEARANSGGCEDVTLAEGSDESEAYFVRYTPTANKRARIYIIFGNKTVTGQYLVLKYRLVNNGKPCELKDTFAATSETTNPMARGNGDACGSFGTLIADGEWHYLIVDLVAKNEASNAAGADLQFKANADGQYACTYIRADFLLQAFDGSCYLDIASVGFTDQYDAASKFVEVCPHTKYNPAEYDAATKSYKIACAMCGEATYQDLLTYLEGRTSLGACQNLTVSTGTENGDDYVRYTQNADARIQFYPIFGNTLITGQYMVIKYRLVNNNTNTELNAAFAATTASSNPMAKGNGDECGTLGILIGDGEWHYLVVDLAAKNKENATQEIQFKADENGKYACAYVRANLLLQTYDGSCYLDIASIGFADHYDAASKFDETCPHTSVKNYEAKAPTCSVVGTEAYSKCNGCGAIIDSEGKEVDDIPTVPTIDHTAKGELVYNATTKMYEDNCTVCGAAVSSQELLTYLEGRVETGACQNLVVSTGTDNGDDYVRYTQNAEARIQFYPIFGNKEVTGQYLILKYRLVNNNTDADLNAAFAATTASTNSMASGNGDECGTLGTLIGDGQWHYLVVDLVAKNKENASAEPQFKADENGNYACSYIRANLLLQAYDGSCYLDIASIGFADQKDVADKVANTCYHFSVKDYEAKASTCTEAGNEAYSVCNGCGIIFNSKGEIVEEIPAVPVSGHTKTLEYVEAEKKCNVECSACGTFIASYPIIYSTESRTSSGGCEDVSISTGEENGDAFARYTPTANKRARIYIVFGNKTVTGQYLILKYRLINNGKDSELKDTFAATTETTNPMARGNGDACGSFGTLIADGEWHYLVVDLAANNAASNAAGADLQFKANADGQYACTYIRADFLLQSSDGSCYLDIAGVDFAG